MFYTLKDDNGRYVTRDSTFSGGYYVQFTENIKYARLWDKEELPKKAMRNYNNHLDKLEAQGKKNEWTYKLYEDRQHVKTVTTRHERIHLVELKLSEL